MKTKSLNSELSERHISLEGSTKVRTLDELKELMKTMISYEEYEICSIIRDAIGNYNELVNQYELTE